ncbi:MAG TPA: hypothetical protein VF041_02520 [Gemmatimonadaceae bacterium]
MRSPLIRLLLLASAACTGRSDSAPARDSASPPPAKAAERDCGVTPSTALTGEGIGELRVGRPVDEVARWCHVLRDTTERREEGQPVRVVTVELGRDTIEAEAVDGRVWRLAVEHTAFRTTDSLGVGTPLARLLELPDVHGASGEGAVFALSPRHCGLSFRLSDGGSRTPRGGWTAGALRALPPRTRVTEVLVIGRAGCE